MTTAAAAAKGRAQTNPDVRESAWTIVRGSSPIVATAVHDGHYVRSAVKPYLELGEAERLREEDPRTGDWVTLAPTNIVVHRSRFEVDLNRSVDQAVYLTPEQAWGLEVWKGPGPPAEIVRAARELHAAFYTQLRGILQETVAKHGRFVLYDLHSYNHRRAGPTAPPEDGRKCPEINLGTGTMERARWTSVVEAFMESLAGVEVLGRHLDIRENIRFRGGYLPDWVHKTFPETGCALAVEVKKFFMDEWTGEVEPVRHAAVGAALAATVPAVQSALESM